MKRKLCKNCIHFPVCANVYGEVTAETEITNVSGKPCHYYSSKKKSAIIFNDNNDLKLLGVVEDFYEAQEIMNRSFRKVFNTAYPDAISSNVGDDCYSLGFDKAWIDSDIGSFDWIIFSI